MRRVVITGIGAASPCGLDTQTTWSSIKDGKSGIDKITLFDATHHTTQVAGEVKGFDPEKHIPKKDVRSMDRFIHLGMAASDYAMADCGIGDEEAFKERIGTFIGVGMCGLGTLESVHETLRTKGPSRVTPYFIPAVIANLAPGQVSMKHGLKGVSYTNTSACASGAHAIGEAFRWIVRGDLDAAIAGGAEAAVTPLGVAGFNAMRALSKRNDAPQKASRPWDVSRDGFVIAEGAGILFLEEREHAIQRGAKIYAEIVGYGATADAYHLTQPAPEGEGAQRAIRMALKDAKLNPEQIDYINAHGTSTPVGDVLEIKAIRHVFGDHAAKLWVSSTKSMTGHLLGAAGGLEAVLSVLAIKEGVVPPTINLDQPDPEVAGIDLVPHESRQRALDAVLSNSFGFGGTNASLIFRKHS